MENLLVFSFVLPVNGRVAIERNFPADGVNRVIESSIDHGEAIEIAGTKNSFNVGNTLHGCRKCCLLGSPWRLKQWRVPLNVGADEIRKVSLSNSAIS
jgi:hypothetical protein